MVNRRRSSRKRSSRSASRSSSSGSSLSRLQRSRGVSQQFSGTSGTSGGGRGTTTTATTAQPPPTQRSTLTGLAAFEIRRATSRGRIVPPTVSGAAVQEFVRTQGATVPSVVTGQPVPVRAPEAVQTTFVRDATGRVVPIRTPVAPTAQRVSRPLQTGTAQQFISVQAGQRAPSTIRTPSQAIAAGQRTQVPTSQLQPNFQTVTGQQFFVPAFTDQPPLTEVTTPASQRDVARAREVQRERRIEQAGRVPTARELRGTFISDILDPLQRPQRAGLTGPFPIPRTATELTLGATAPARRQLEAETVIPLERSAERLDVISARRGGFNLITPPGPGTLPAVLGGGARAGANIAGFVSRPRERAEETVVGAAAFGTVSALGTRDVIRTTAREGPRAGAAQVTGAAVTGVALARETARREPSRIIAPAIEIAALAEGPGLLREAGIAQRRRFVAGQPFASRGQFRIGDVRVRRGPLIQESVAGQVETEALVTGQTIRRDVTGELLSLPKEGKFPSSQFVFRGRATGADLPTTTIRSAGRSLTAGKGRLAAGSLVDVGGFGRVRAPTGTDLFLSTSQAATAFDTITGVRPVPRRRLSELVIDTTSAQSLGRAITLRTRVPSVRRTTGPKGVTFRSGIETLEFGRGRGLSFTRRGERRIAEVAEDTLFKVAPIRSDFIASAGTGATRLRLQRQLRSGQASTASIERAVRTLQLAQQRSALKSIFDRPARAATRARPDLGIVQTTGAFALPRPRGPQAEFAVTTIPRTRGPTTISRSRDSVSQFATTTLAPASFGRPRLEGLITVPAPGRETQLQRDLRLGAQATGLTQRQRTTPLSQTALGILPVQVPRSTTRARTTQATAVTQIPAIDVPQLPRVPTRPVAPPSVPSIPRPIIPSLGLGLPQLPVFPGRPRPRPRGRGRARTRKTPTLTGIIVPGFAQPPKGQQAFTALEIRPRRGRSPVLEQALFGDSIFEDLIVTEGGGRVPQNLLFRERPFRGISVAGLTAPGRRGIPKRKKRTTKKRKKK